jgi:uncharacterized membrane protein YidH (DUF202 family)
MAVYAKTVEEIINKTTQEIINPFIVFLAVLATVIFLWGIVEFVAGADNEEKRNLGKKHIIWGILGLAIMLGVFGIMQILYNFWY